MRSDREIERDVKEELKWEPGLPDAADIAVSVKNGVVTLAGFVKSYTDKYEAEAAAKRVAGVLGVANDIEVRMPSVDERPDPEIARDAVAAIKTQLPILVGAHQSRCQKRLGKSRRPGRVAIPAQHGRKCRAADQRCQGSEQPDSASAAS